MKLGLREANRQFSRAIRAVREGKEVVLTERGRPVAVIKPIASRSVADAALRAMTDDSLVTLPSRKGPTPMRRWKPITLKGKPLSQTVIDDREERV